ncbi:hypothetical protein DACRYDRAFT_106147 [Dacryopinax primogenitus]|uniref:RNI-like protein n=1 Tax=Dacryopinax primogenitus (strain DJM 731) TaxID=1858805 RepID=M5G432_DACPD|nr:uncharacterized protein DACRYDRAFT_106147 [Dacryopinax primogenitus]EJU02970.1 hypothetical protein DACRYDRAFT_106147 [Dacryopinax primogenitus]
MPRPQRPHRVWIVEDVICDVMSYCAPRDICNLGMTCHCLFQIYLDVVFGELDSLGPLYGVLPDPSLSPAAPTGLRSLISRSHASKKAHNPKTHSVGRITMYTARVRSLTIGQGGEDDAHRINNLRSILGPLPLQTCFPQLQSLRIIADDPRTVANSIPLALPMLRSFALIINFEDRKLDLSVKDSYESSGLPVYFRHLRSLSRLDSLTITCANTSRRPVSEVEAHGLLYLTRQFPRLSTLDISNLILTDTLVHNLSKLPMLERLFVCLPNGKESVLTPGPLAFSNLHHLTINCDATELSWFMHGLQAPHLASLQLHAGCRALCPQTAPKFSELVGAKFRNLRVFGLHVWSEDGSDTCWTFASFHGMLRCRAMECFGVMLPSLVIATDEDVQLIVKAWPRLRDLQLGHSQVTSDFERPSPGSTSLFIQGPGCVAFTNAKLPLTVAGVMLARPSNDETILNFHRRNCSCYPSFIPSNPVIHLHLP